MIFSKKNSWISLRRLTKVFYSFLFYTILFNSNRFNSILKIVLLDFNVRHIHPTSLENVLISRHQRTRVNSNICFKNLFYFKKSQKYICRFITLYKNFSLIFVFENKTSGATFAWWVVQVHFTKKISHTHLFRFQFTLFPTQTAKLTDTEGVFALRTLKKLRKLDRKLFLLVQNKSISRHNAWSPVSTEQFSPVCLGTTHFCGISCD